jgi:hypothetical protein
MCITPLLPVAHRAGERVTWLKSQWKFSVYPVHFCVEIYIDTADSGQLCLSALFMIVRNDEPPPIELTAGKFRAVSRANFDHASVWPARFSLAAERLSTYPPRAAGAGARISNFLLSLALALLLACLKNRVKSHAAAIKMRVSRRVGMTSMP